MVPLSIIPAEHLIHLVSGIKLPAKAKNELIELCHHRDLAARQSVLAELEKHEPDVRDRLLLLWASAGRHAMHMWTLPCLDGKSAQDVLAKSGLSPAQRKRVLDGEEVKIPVPNAELAEDQVVRISLGADKILARVRLRHDVSLRRDDDVIREQTTHDVTATIDFSAQNRLVSVFAGYGDSRNALFTFLEWLMGQPVSRRKNASQEKMLRAVSFTEAQVHAFCEREGLELIKIDGPDPKSVNEGQEARAKLVRKGDTRRLPMVFSDERNAAQLNESNYRRSYNLDFLHPDGFKEQSEVDFYFESKQPHVIFLKRTTGAAVAYVVKLIRQGAGV